MKNIFIVIALSSCLVGCDEGAIGPKGEQGVAGPAGPKGDASGSISGAQVRVKGK